MAFQLSPSVDINERDLTTTVPSVSTSIGALVGQFAWGPVNEIRNIYSENRLLERFGEPNNQNYKDWFVAADFLSYSNNLKVVRVVVEPEVDDGAFVDPSGGNAAYNASDDGNGTSVLNEDHYEENYNVLESEGIVFAARYPGKKGNSLVVEVAKESAFDSSPVWDYADEFDEVPSDSDNEVAIAILDDGVLEETFVVSLDEDAKDYRGKSKYIDDVLRQRSWLVWSVEPNLTDDLEASGADDSFTYDLSGGTDGDAIGESERMDGWDLFSNAEEVDVNLLMVGGANETAAQYVLDNIAESRLDCVAFISPQEGSVVNSKTPVEDLKDDIDFYNSSSYGFFDGNYKRRYDRYNDKYRWTPLNGDMAGLEARTDDSHDPWWASAGYNRGHVKNVIKLAFNPKRPERDLLYKNNINPIITESGDGTVLLGQKTMQAKPSAFDRLNVRRLFITIEKAIATMAKYNVMFEINDEVTRQTFINAVEPYLRNVAGRRGIEQFHVQCDEENNPPQVVSNNGFVADIYVDPANVAEFIKLNFIAAEGVTFDEVVESNE